MRSRPYPPTAARSSRATANQTPSQPGAAAASTSRAKIHPRDCARSGTVKVNPIAETESVARRWLPGSSKSISASTPLDNRVADVERGLKGLSYEVDQLDQKLDQHRGESAKLETLRLGGVIDEDPR